MPFCMRVDARNWKCGSVFARSGEAERMVTLEAPSEQDARDYDLARAPTTMRLGYRDSIRASNSGNSFGGVNLFNSHPTALPT